MKPLDRLLRLHARPDSSHMEAAIDAVLKREGARIVARLAAEQPAVSRSRIGLRFAVVATLILTVAIGVYAFRAQRASSPKVVVLTAQSSAAAETPQVAVLTPGSTKPEAAPSREEILRGVAAQIAAAQASDAGAARPKFAAASVRPILPPGPGTGGNFFGLTCLGADGLLWRPAGGQSSPARRGACRAGTLLSALVIAAYASSQRVEMLGFPFKPAPHFQIEAIADDPERVTKGELQQMLQTLLEDRFKARVHFETREVDGFVLTIAKSGIKFKETSDQPMVARGMARMMGKYTMANVIDHLGLQLGVEPVLDKTGLTGVYDMKLDIERIQLAAPREANGVRGNGDDGRKQFNPPVPKAFEDQLGLHLEPAKVPVQFIIVDHLEMPTEN